MGSTRDFQQNQSPNGGENGSVFGKDEPHVREVPLKPMEKIFLLYAERGDCQTIKRLILEYKDKPEQLNINCVDPLNRCALVAAIENENMDLIKLLLQANVEVKDALLHAIKEEYLEAVELLLKWEDDNLKPGQPYSWERVNSDSSIFTFDITPLILAAHKDNYEIVKILLDRGATLPLPHDIKCGCDDCVEHSKVDSLRHSQARINAYKALISPSLIALSSKDPFLSAFELSQTLRKLSKIESEFREEYKNMRVQLQHFSTTLLDHARTSRELEIILNYDPNGENDWTPGERQTLERLRLAIKYQQKMFVVHPNVQQLLAAIWYEGVPGFRRKNLLWQTLNVIKLFMMFPIYCTVYMIVPNSKMGQFMKNPFVKFVCHSASYIFFLMFVCMASQRIEILLMEWFGTEWMKEIVKEWKIKERGSFFGVAECVVIFYVISLIWGAMKALWTKGLREYATNLWNCVDFIINMFYLNWIALRLTSWHLVLKEPEEGKNPWYPREQWGTFDPMLLSEGAFAAGMIFSFLKLVHIFSVSPHLGPLQISLGRMVVDIVKFFFIYTLVLFAFGCGLNQLLWYYAVLEKDKCFSSDGSPDFQENERACTIWRRYSNFFETSQSLFWASFGLIDLVSFDLTGIKGFTRFWALLMFGSYSFINIIVLLNMLIAMMSNSYQIISTKSKSTSRERYESVINLLLKRYVTVEQQKRFVCSVTEDDVKEIRQDISTLRYELINILHKNGMITPQVLQEDAQVCGRKEKIIERRILNDFYIGAVEGLLNNCRPLDGPRSVFNQIVKVIRRSRKSRRQKWNALVQKRNADENPIGLLSRHIEAEGESKGKL